MQNTHHLLMIRPVRFAYNAETAVNNAFQVASTDAAVTAMALREFDDFVAVLKSNGIEVTVVEDSEEPETPDAVFPNNWISMHEDGRIFLYPMFAANRRLERKPAVLERLATDFRMTEQVDLTAYEKENRFLEGTGSMVLDREHKIAYACLSPRTDPRVLKEFCRQTGFSTVLFHARDRHGGLIYHTNVMMCVADSYAVVCMESVTDASDRQLLTDRLEATGKELVPISMDQLYHFAGNMLQVKNRNGRLFLIMSTQAFDALTEVQRTRLEAHNPIIHSSLLTIESNGGGSARCMMAEIFLPEKH